MHRTALVALLLVIPGCAFSPDTEPGASEDDQGDPTPRVLPPLGTWHDDGCTDNGTAVPDKAHAWVLNRTHVSKWLVGRDGISFVTDAAWRGQWVGAANGTAYGAGPHHVVRFADDLQGWEAIDLPEITAFLADESGIYVVSNWTLIVLDHALREQWRLEVRPPGGNPHKVIDHIAVEGDGVFLVDDVMMPYYGFIANGTTRELHATVEWSGNQGTRFHAVRDGIWYIDAGFSGSHGGRSGVERFGQDGERLDAWTLSRSEHGFHGGQSRMTGWNIWDLSVDGRLLLRTDKLAWVELASDGIHLGCSAPWEGLGFVATHGALGVVAGQEEVVALWTDGHVVRQQVHGGRFVLDAALGGT